jgi:hypothetical protein
LRAVARGCRLEKLREAHGEQAFLILNKERFVNSNGRSSMNKKLWKLGIFSKLS